MEVFHELRHRCGARAGWADRMLGTWNNRLKEHDRSIEPCLYSPVSTEQLVAYNTEYLRTAADNTNSHAVRRPTAARALNEVVEDNSY
mgnify:CR=1 FL=1